MWHFYKTQQSSLLECLPVHFTYMFILNINIYSMLNSMVLNIRCSFFLTSSDL